MAKTIEHALVVPLALSLLAGAAAVCANCYKQTRADIVIEVERLTARSEHGHLYDPRDETGTVVVDAKGLLQLCGAVSESMELWTGMPGRGTGDETG